MSTPRPLSRRLTLASAGLLLVSGLAACGSSSPDGAAPPDGEGLALVASEVERSAGDPEAMGEVAAALQGLAGRLYGELSDADDENLALSPYSIAVALAMTANGADGVTLEEMLAVLGTDDLAGFNEGLNALTQYVEGLAGRQKRRDGSEAEIALDAANQLFGHHETVWEPEFLDTLARKYGAGMRTVDYVTATEEARRLINGWTADRTRARVPEIIPEGVIDALTRLVLVNALYLKAPWEEPFQADGTTERSFHLLDGSTVDVDTMTGTKEQALHGTGDGWEAVRLGYAGGRLAMTVVVPVEGQLADVEALVAGGGLSTVLDELSPERVQVTLPRWVFRSTSPLKEQLEALGMSTPFSPDADFLGMTTDENSPDERELFIKEVLHETFIAVDEEGTEAAAATAVVVTLESMPRPVVVDRPFLFVIHDVRHGTPLFLGRVTDPSQG